jgi:hypothetical protein
VNVRGGVSENERDYEPNRDKESEIVLRSYFPPSEGAIMSFTAVPVDKIQDKIRVG